MAEEAITPQETPPGPEGADPTPEAGEAASPPLVTMVITLEANLTVSVRGPLPNQPLFEMLLNGARMARDRWEMEAVAEAQARAAAGGPRIAPATIVPPGFRGFNRGTRQRRG